MKNVAVLTEDVAFALFFRPHPGDLPSKAKKNANARGSACGDGAGWVGGVGWTGWAGWAGWAQMELTDALLRRWVWSEVSCFL